MRTLNLINALTESELKKVEILLNQPKRKNLKSLFIALKKYRGQETEPKRDELFSKVFKKKYTAVNEHLLRNKLSRLNDILYEYLATATFKETITEDQTTFNLWLAKCYSKRNMKPLFTSDVDGFISQANELVRLDEASQLYAIRANWSTAFADGGQLKGIEIITQWQNEEEKRFLHRSLRADYLKAYLQVSMPEYSQEKNKDLSVVKGSALCIDIDKLSSDDWYVRLLQLQNLQLKGPEDERLKYMEDMISITKNGAVQKVVGIKMHLLGLANYGYCLANLYRFDEAASSFNEAIRLFRAHKIPLPLPLILNTIATSLIRGEYDEGIEMYTYYKKLGTQSIAHSTIEIAYLFCLFFSGRVDEVFDSVQSIKAENDNETVHTRYLFILSFIARGDFPLAVNEATNLKKTVIKFDKKPFVEYALELITFLKRYTESLMMGEVKRRKLQTTIINTPMLKTLQKQDDTMTRVVAVWLQKQIERDAA